MLGFCPVPELITLMTKIYHQALCSLIRVEVTQLKALFSAPYCAL